MSLSKKLSQQAKAGTLAEHIAYFSLQLERDLICPAIFFSSMSMNGPGLTRQTPWPYRQDPPGENNHAGEALDFLGRVAKTSGDIENQRIKAYLQLQEYARAEELAAHPLLATNLETMSHRVRLASLLQLPVDEYLQRMDRMLDTQVKMMAAKVD